MPVAESRPVGAATEEVADMRLGGENVVKARREKLRHGLFDGLSAFGGEGLFGNDFALLHGDAKERLLNLGNRGSLHR